MSTDTPAGAAGRVSASEALSRVADPAGREHRFEDFSEDFATWVLFYGPEGGEAAD